MLQQKEQVFLSKSLAEIKKSVPIDFDLQKSLWKEYNKEKVIEILKGFEFKSLIERLPRPTSPSAQSKAGGPEFKKSEGDDIMEFGKQKTLF